MPTIKSLDNDIQSQAENFYNYTVFDQPENIRPLGSASFSHLIAAGLDKSAQEIKYGAMRVIGDLTGYEDSDFDKYGFYRSQFGDDDRYLGKFLDQVNDLDQANQFVKTVETEQYFDEMQDDFGIISTMAAEFATDPVALAIAFGTGPAYSAAKGLAGKVAISFADGAAYEALKTFNNPTRTLAESGATIAASTILGGVVGHQISKIGGKKIDGEGVMYKMLEDTKRTYDSAVNAVSARIPKESLELFSRVNALKAPLAYISRLSPRERLFSIPSFKGREMLFKLNHPTLETVGTASGLPTPASVASFRNDVIDNFQVNLQLPLQNLVDDTVRMVQKSELDGTPLLNKIPGADTIVLRKKVNDDIYDMAYNDALSLQDLILMKNATDDPYQSKIIDGAIMRRNFYNGVKDQAVNANMKGFGIKKNYAGIASFDRTKITDENRFELASRLQRAIDEYTEPKMRRLGEKADKSDQLYRGYLQSAIDDEELAEALLRQASDVEGQGIINKDIDEVLETLGKQGDEAKKRAQDALERAERAADEWQKDLGALGKYEDLKERMVESIMSHIENGTLDMPVTAGQRVSGSVPYFFKHRLFNPTQFKEFMHKDLNGLDAAYSRLYGTKYGLKQVFGTTEADSIISSYRDEVFAQVKTMREAATALKNGDDSLYNKAVDGPDSEVSDLLKKTGKDPSKISAEYAKLQSGFDDGAKGARQEFVSMLSRLEGSTYRQAYQNMGSAGGYLWAADGMLTTSSMAFGATSMIPEIFAPVFANGMKAVVPQMKTVLGLVRRDKALTSIGERAALETGNLHTWISHSLIGDMIDETGNLGVKNLKGTGVYESAMKGFFKINLMAPFDKYLRIASQLTNDHIMFDFVGKVANGTASKREVGQLARLGYSASEAKDLYKVMAKGRIKHSGTGMTFTNFEAIPVAQKFKLREAMRRNMDNTMLASREGDIPHVFSHPIVRMLAKFKNWSTLATTRYLTSGLQHADAQTWATWSFMTAMGMSANELKEVVVGRDVSGNKFIDKVYGGISASGYFGLGSELGMDFIANKAFGIEGGSAKFAGGDTWEDIAGPSAKVIKAVDDVKDVVGVALDPNESFDEPGEFSRATYNLQRLMPGNQIVRRALDLIEEE